MEVDPLVGVLVVPVVVVVDDDEELWNFLGLNDELFMLNSVFPVVVGCCWGCCWAPIVMPTPGGMVAVVVVGGGGCCWGCCSGKYVG